MRIWSLHPKYLDAKGLVALWRETLLAKNVLQNKTKGYKHHPQLNRFKNSQRPIATINLYLSFVYDEASARGYKFDKKKFIRTDKKLKLTVTSKQLDYEVKHLLKKLKVRDPKKFKELKSVNIFQPHSLFKVIPGNIESWEIISK
jgi:Pyrimidine dimer DNA glycosylase